MSDIQYIIFTVGHIASGKSTLCKKISEELGISRLSKDNYRDFLISDVKYYNDGRRDCYNNKKIYYIDQSVNILYDSLIENLLVQGQDILLDVGNIRKINRSELFDICERHTKKAYKKIAINVNISPETLLDRLRKREREQEGSKWLEFHFSREENLSFPSTDECDYILNYNQDNADEIISELKNIMDIK